MKLSATHKLRNGTVEDQPAACVELSTRPKGRIALLSLLLMAATFVAYIPIAGNSFINLDDRDYILGTPEIRGAFNWNLVHWAFTTFAEGNWHPLTWLSHAIDYRLFHSNPVGVHLENVFWHALTAALLFVLLAEVSSSKWKSLAVGALYALHPLSVEAVAWGAERKTVLSMFFFVVGLWTYGRYATGRKLGWYLAVLAAFAMGLMAKPQIVTFPFVLLLWDVWPLRRLQWDNSKATLRQFGSLVLEKIPLFVLSAVSSVTTMRAQTSGGAVSSLAVYPLSLRVGNAIVSYARYLGKTLWPSNLAVLYPYPAAGVPTWQVASAALLLLAISTLVLLARSRPYLLIGWLWFLGTLVPMIGLVQVGMAAMADRYAGLPLIGLFIMTVWGIGDVVRGFAIPAKWVLLGTSVVLVLLSVMTYRQVQYWRDSESIWSHALQVADDNLVAEVNLGVALFSRGQTDEAIFHFQRALRFDPRDPAANFYVGLYEVQRGEDRPGAQHLATALNSLGNTPVPWKEMAYTDLGTAYRQMGEYQKARESFQVALGINPGNLAAEIGMGLVAQHEGNVSEAIRWYSQTMATQPNAVAALLLAKALEQNGEYEKSKRAHDEALQLTSDLNASQSMVERMLGHAE